MENNNVFYKKHKNTILVLGLLLACLFVIVQVIWPQINQIRDNFNKMEVAQKKVETLKESLSVLAKISDQELEEYYDLTNRALPQGKDILSIFNELIFASQRTETTLGDLTINLGDIFSREGEVDISNSPPLLGSPSVNFTVNLEGNVENIRSFAQELYRSIPVVEVTGITFRNDRGELEANFFFNPLADTSTDSDKPAKVFSEDEVKLVLELKNWSDAATIDSSQLILQNPSDNENAQSGTASSSLTPSVSPAVNILPNQ